jgi:hypothetical protein
VGSERDQNLKQRNNNDHAWIDAISRSRQRHLPLINLSPSDQNKNRQKRNMALCRNFPKGQTSDSSEKEQNLERGGQRIPLTVDDHDTDDI